MCQFWSACATMYMLVHTQLHSLAFRDDSAFSVLPVLAPASLPPTCGMSAVDKRIQQTYSMYRCVVCSYMYILYVQMCSM